MKSNLLFLFIFKLAFICTPSFSQITFQKTYGTASDDFLHFVQQTSDNGYILIGITQISGISHRAFFIVKTDSLGNTCWTRIIDDSSAAFQRCIKQTFDNGYIILGSEFLIKIDSIGNLEWAKEFNALTGDFDAIQQTPDSGFIFTGTSYNGSNTDIFLIRTNKIGDTLWTKTYNSFDDDWASSVNLVKDGGYIVTGTTTWSVANIGMCFILKTDSLGNMQWSRCYEVHGGISIQQTYDGGFILTAEDNATLILKLDSAGFQLWSRLYDLNSGSTICQVQQTSDSGFVIVSTLQQNNNRNIFLVKTDSIGIPIWIKSFGSTGDEMGYSVQEVKNGGYIVAGVTNSIAGNGWDFYVIKTDENGNSGCMEQSMPLTQTSGTITPWGVGITVSHFSGPFISRTFPIGSGGAVSTLCESIYVPSLLVEKGPTLFPNPSSGNFEISFSPNKTSGSIQITNILGEVVCQRSFYNSSEEQFSLKELIPGIYFAKMDIENKSHVRKFIIDR